MSIHQDVSRTIAALHARLDLLKLKPSCNLGYFPPNQAYPTEGNDNYREVTEWYLNQITNTHRNRTINNELSYHRILRHYEAHMWPWQRQKIIENLYTQFNDEIHNARATNVFDLQIADNLMNALYNATEAERENEREAQREEARVRRLLRRRGMVPNDVYQMQQDVKRGR
jgi:hypothetical protein